MSDLEKTLEAHVVWGDGLGDTARECTICWSNTCIKPVHAEQYKVISDKIAKKWDEDNQVI
jgi:hypothetical protein